MAMYEYEIAPDSHAIRQVLAQAVGELANYTVSFVYNGRHAGSGTLVVVKDSFGILTAEHVARTITSDDMAVVGINMMTSLNKFVVPAAALRHVPLGAPAPRDKFSAEGPDLAFLRITDESKLGWIRAKKSFYPLERRAFEEHRDSRLEGHPWFIAGAPEEMKIETAPRNDPNFTLGIPTTFLQATFLQSQPSRGFERWMLQLDCNRGNYPSDYEGCSGGGVWMIPLAKDPDQGMETLHCLGPILAGVNFWQEPAGQKMHIMAQGPRRDLQ